MNCSTLRRSESYRQIGRDDFGVRQFCRQRLPAVLCGARPERRGIPFAASLRAKTSPMPLEAPVIRATGLDVSMELLSAFCRPLLFAPVCRHGAFDSFVVYGTGIVLACRRQSGYGCLELHVAQSSTSARSTSAFPATFWNCWVRFSSARPTGILHVQRALDVGGNNPEIGGAAFLLHRLIRAPFAHRKGMRNHASSGLVDSEWSDAA